MPKTDAKGNVEYSAIVEIGVFFPAGTPFGTIVSSFLATAQTNGCEVIAGTGPKGAVLAAHPIPTLIEELNAGIGEMGGGNWDRLFEQAEKAVQAGTATPDVVAYVNTYNAKIEAHAAAYAAAVKTGQAPG